MGGKETGGRNRIGIGHKKNKNLPRFSKLHFTFYNRYKRLHCWYTFCAHQTVRFQPR